MRFLQSDNKSKVEILIEQFQSVFTEEIPNNFSIKGKVHIASWMKSKLAHREYTELSTNNLKKHKASGPDSIPPFIIKIATEPL